jgi:hypothetical protein
MEIQTKKCMKRVKYTDSYPQKLAIHEVTDNFADCKVLGNSN